MDLGREAHVYDVREQRYVGFSDKVSTYVTPAAPQVFSLLPYRVGAVTLVAPATVKQGDTVAYRSASGPARSRASTSSGSRSWILARTDSPSSPGIFKSSRIRSKDHLSSRISPAPPPGRASMIPFSAGMSSPPRYR